MHVYACVCVSVYTYMYIQTYICAYVCIRLDDYMYSRSIIITLFFHYINVIMSIVVGLRIYFSYNIHLVK